MGTVSDILGEAWGLWVGALRLDPDTAAVVSTPTLLPLLLIALVAADAGMVGRAAVLSINRIRGLTRLLGLASNLLGLLLVQTAMGLALWAVGRLALAGELGPWQVTALVLLSSAPLAFDFLTAIPLLGTTIHRLLLAWCFAIQWATMADVHHLSAWTSGVLVAVATLVTWGLTAALEPPVFRARAALWRRITGRPLHLDPGYLLAIGPTPRADP